MAKQTKLGCTFMLPGTSISLYRMGYGAMQLAGPGVWGPPRDPGGAIAVLREAIASGVNHIDTSDFYGPHVTNQVIKQALHPLPGWPDNCNQSGRPPVVRTNHGFMPLRVRSSSAAFMIIFGISASIGLTSSTFGPAASRSHRKGRSRNR
jgi:hypothetical protein